MDNRTNFREGLRDGVPIGLGYFAVSFSLGIAARNAGITPLQGFIMSFLVNASAGEFAGITVIAANAPYLEMAIMIFVANARYILMSAALSQKIRPETAIGHRLLLGFDVTDEIFGISIARKGFLNPVYTYGAMITTIPFWATGTALGIIAGNSLPVRIVSALSVALYGMFLAVIIPPAKESKIVAGVVLVSFAASWCAGVIPLTAKLSGGMRIIFLTVIIAGIAACLFPVKEENHES